DKCIHELFMEQVAAHPDKIAVVYEGQQLTYQALYEQSHALAVYLQAQGVKPDSRVGVCLTRTPQMIVTMLGILMAGGAYIPLDPNYPDERLAHMLADSQATIVVSQQSLQQKLCGLLASDTGLILLDSQWLEIASEAKQVIASGGELAQIVCPQHLAYVIYTSGSTGKSKGVAIEHRSAVALIHWAQSVYSEQELSGVLAATSISFDLSVYELFLTLASGGKVLLVKNILDLSEGAHAADITLINTVPSAIEALLRAQAIPKTVLTINLAGEPLPTALVDKLYQHTGVTKVYDLYGPSEDTTYSTFTLRVFQGVQTIGRPISNTQAYVLDQMGQPVA
ncbi:AMP-binding protein, partial [Pseudoalteromonas sp. BMB]|uniref:AMP-binding protein n=1 Tax=Pseudoalteromonas sp. BMB TaxID=1874619 RepID=UPI0011130197